MKIKLTAETTKQAEVEPEFPALELLLNQWEAWASQEEQLTVEEVKIARDKLKLAIQTDIDTITGLLDDGQFA